MPGLAAIHTIWVREHNRIAKLISGHLGHMGDERVFQEARRINIAQMQNIVYNDWLPIILGKSFTDDAKNGLQVTEAGTTYDPNVDPSMENGFASAAFRIGHSMLQGMIQLTNPFTFNVETEIPLRLEFFNDTNYENPNGITNMMVGLSTQPMQRIDSHMTEEVTNFLFAPAGSDHGEDLIARNLQRSRDHFLGGYLEYRKKFSSLGSEEIKCFNTRPSDIPKKKWDELENLYINPQDIDLFTGGHVEDPVDDALVGATFRGMIGKQIILISKKGRGLI